MWIALRLIVAIAAFAIRFAKRISIPAVAGRVNGQPYYLQQEKDKDHNIAQIKIGVRLKSPVIFRLTKETSLDRFFKTIGIALEFQTRDSDFDRAIYIACDHGSFMKVLKESKATRARILKIFSLGFREGIAL